MHWHLRLSGRLVVLDPELEVPLRPAHQPQIIFLMSTLNLTRNIINISTEFQSTIKEERKEEADYEGNCSVVVLLLLND